MGVRRGAAPHGRWQSASHFIDKGPNSDGLKEQTPGQFTGAFTADCSSFLCNGGGASVLHWAKL
jgi:hypothetical protein